MKKNKIMAALAIIVLLTTIFVIVQSIDEPCITVPNNAGIKKYQLCWQEIVPDIKIFVKGRNKSKLIVTAVPDEFAESIKMQIEVQDSTNNVVFIKDFEKRNCRSAAFDTTLEMNANNLRVGVIAFGFMRGKRNLKIISGVAANK